MIFRKERKCFLRSPLNIVSISVGIIRHPRRSRLLSRICDIYDCVMTHDLLFLLNISTGGSSRKAILIQPVFFLACPAQIHYSRNLEIGLAQPTNNKYATLTLFPSCMNRKSVDLFTLQTRRRLIHHPSGVLLRRAADCDPIRPSIRPPPSQRRSPESIATHSNSLKHNVVGDGTFRSQIRRLAARRLPRWVLSCCVFGSE